MKRVIFFGILAILVGSLAYHYLSKHNSIYNAILPANYENFEKDMFTVLIKMKVEDKNLLLNYSLRFKKSPSQVSVKEAVDNERIFEKTNEGTVFFSKLKEEDKKNSILDEISDSAFVTFVDFSSNEKSINIVFSIKNKSSYVITHIAGDTYFVIGTDKFSTVLDFNTNLPPTETTQIVKVFNFSEFPALKDMSKNSIFKMNIRQINFENKTALLII